MTLPGAFFGFIPIPNIQRISSPSRANIIEHRADSGFSFNQIAQRELTTIRIEFILRGDARNLILSALEFAFERHTVSPFRSSLKFLPVAIITDIDPRKSKDIIGALEVTVTIREVIQSQRALAALIIDATAYALGKIGDITITRPDGTTTIRDEVEDTFRSIVKDTTGFALTGSESIVEAAIVTAVQVTVEGLTFLDIVG